MPRDRKLVQFYSLVPKFWGPSPEKKFVAKNVQNYGRLWTTTKFDRKYIRNEWRYLNRKTGVSTAIRPAFGEKKFGKLRSTNNIVGDVSLDPSKSAFSDDHISAPRRCCPFKFLHALENDQSLLASAHPTGDWVPENKYNDNDDLVNLHRS